MRRVDVRVYVLAVLVVCAAGLGVYRMKHPSHARSTVNKQLFTAPVDVSPMRIRSMVDTTAKLLGAPKKYISRRTADDSGRVVLESTIGVPAAFDELRLITMLGDSLRPGGGTVTGAKSLKEKSTTIRFWNRDHICIYRCILYRKELPH
jgi:hypothetical protein